MKISDIGIDGFGVWHDLKLKDLSPRLTAFYGANEAGKTTLMQFVRSVLYGMSPKRRSRYLPPLRGGTPGGILGIVDNQQSLQVSRIADRGPEDVGLVTISTPDGKSNGDRLLREALADVDEPTFNNIFAIGLSEIQQLSTLSDTKAAEWLYRLTSGLDRVSLYDVIQGLRQTRRDLLCDDQHESKIMQLVAEREVLRGEIQQLMQRGRLWSQLAVRIQEFDGQITEQEAAVHECQRRARTIEIAVGLKPNWRKRQKISTQLQQFSGTIQLPVDAIDQLDKLNRKIENRQREADILEGQRRQLREDSEQLGINQLLEKNFSRIDALAEQRDWLQSLERQMEDLGAEAEELEQRLDNEQQRLGRALGVADRKQLKEITAADMEGMQPHIKEIRVAQKELDCAQKDLDALAENESSLRAKIDSAIVGGEHHGLPMDLREASDLVANLRKRMQVEQRLEQARNHETDMEQQSYDLLDDQVMPLAVFNWSLAAVVFGALMVGVWLWVPDSPLGNLGGLLALGGLATGAFCFLFKFFTEDAAADKLDSCQRQIDVLARQIEEAQRDKRQLDAELPMADGSVLIRLQAAERHLKELENVLPVEARRKQAGYEVATAESHVSQARAQLDNALTSWRSKLIALGFSEKIDPQQFLTVTQRYGALHDLEGRAKLRREDIAARQREYNMLTRRVTDLIGECGLRNAESEAENPKSKIQNPNSITTIEQLEHLVSERRKQLADIERRNELSERARQLKGEEAKHRRAIVAIRRRREAMFHVVNCEDEPAYRRLAEEQFESMKLRKQRKRISREISAAVGQHAAEEIFAEFLSPQSVNQLDTLWESESEILKSTQNELKSLVDQRGALRQEQRTSVEDRLLAERNLELSCVEKQLADARQSWREHATVNRVLERIRKDYEKHRQPETLAEASRYLDKLTDGEYQRVWTPLAEDVLLVENREGESLTVDQLSRGTREQLFLSVRLALVANFARRGINLPMVLDDVLVNFDAIRAQRAAEVLCEFAAGGHQLLVFTCHEHMWQMFKVLDTDSRRLPSRRGRTLPELGLEEIPVEQLFGEPIGEIVEEVIEPPPKPKKRRRSRKKVEEDVVEVAPEPESIDFYDYPFVETIEQGVVEKSDPIADASTEASYEWAIEETPTDQSPDNALAYIHQDAAESTDREATYYDRAYHDHLEPRRA